MPRSIRLVVLALSMLWPVRQGLAEEPAASGGHLGGAGLLEMRTARFREDGALEAGAALRRQRRFYFLSFQALPFLETTFRLSERLDGTAGRGITTDRALDLRLRLLREDAWTPAVAIGLQDLLGTGIYAGEHLTASKRFGPFDLTLGLGWGRLGTGGDVPNPLGLVSDRFETRPRAVGRGGRPSFRSWFRGRDVSVFGGVEYAVPPVDTPLGVLDGLRAKLEWSGDALRDERGGYPARQTGLRGEAASRLNVGLQWQNDWLEAGLSFVNGSDLLARVSFRLDPARPPPPPLPPAVPALPPRPAGAGDRAGQVAVPAGAFVVVPPASRTAPPPMPEPAPGDAAGEAAALGPRVFAALAEAGFQPLAFGLDAAQARITVAEGRFRTLPQVAARVLRATNDLLPASVEAIRLSWWTRGAEVAELIVPRAALEAAARGTGSPEEAFGAATLLPATGAAVHGPGTVRNPPPFLSLGLEPRLALILGDPSRTLRWQAGVAAGARLDLGAGFALSGTVQQALFGNLDDAPPSDSRLPRVRSDYGRYASEGRTSIPVLTAERIWNLAPDVFARATAGLVEPMFGGVSAEVLWRPHDRPWAVGVDVNRVRQRDFDGLTGFRRYEVTTGHVSLYADLPVWNLYTVLRAGRYLAGDWGGTIEVGRRFDSGIEVGGFATFTDVPFSRFGEGSFDKGIYVRVPLALFGAETRGVGAALIRPVQRDGGQRLAVENPLWSVTRDGRADALRRGIEGFAR